MVKITLFRRLLLKQHKKALVNSTLPSGGRRCARGKRTFQQTKCYGRSTRYALLLSCAKTSSTDVDDSNARVSHVRKQKRRRRCNVFLFIVTDISVGRHVHFSTTVTVYINPGPRRTSSIDNSVNTDFIGYAPHVLLRSRASVRTSVPIYWRFSVDIDIFSKNHYYIVS